MSCLRVQCDVRPRNHLEAARPLLVFLGEGTTALVRLSAGELCPLHDSLRAALGEPAGASRPDDGGPAVVCRDAAVAGHRRTHPYSFCVGGSVLARMTRAEAREFLVSVERARERAEREEPRSVAAAR